MGKKIFLPENYVCRHRESAGAAARVLQKLEIPVMDRKICENLISKFIKPDPPSPRDLCAGYLTAGKDSCVCVNFHAVFLKFKLND
jgi:hypothetical protein